MTLASRFCRRAALALLVLFALPVAVAAAAHDPTPVVTTIAIDLSTVLATIALVLAGVGAILGGLSPVLHAIASRTKTTVDDRLAADVDAAHVKADAAHAKLDELREMFERAFPGAGVPSATSELPTVPNAPARRPQSGRARLVLLGLLAAIAVALLSSSGCVSAAQIKAAPGQLKTAGIQCAKEDAPQIANAVAQLGAGGVTQALGGATPDWDALLAGDLQLGEAIAWCAAVAFVDAFGKGPRAAPDTGPGAAARAALERLRARIDGPSS